MAFGNPSQAQINATTTIKGGDIRVARDQDGHLFASGLLDPEHSSVLSYLFPQYTATAMLEQIGRYEGVPQNTWSWSELDRTRASVTVTAVAGSVLTTDFPAATASEGYYLIGDQIKGEDGRLYKVTAIGSTGTFQTITVQGLDGNATVTVAANEKIGHIANVFGEGSSAPNGRRYLPNERYNYLQKFRRSIYVTGDALSSRTYVGKNGVWVYEQEMIDMDEFAKDRENAIMFGEMSDPAVVGASGQYTTEGIVTSVLAGGVTGNYAPAAFDEQDLQAQITAMRISSPANEYTVFCGAEFMQKAQVSLKDYTISGGVSFGSFGKNLFGIDCQSYKFFSTTINFVHYPTFDDTHTLPYSGNGVTASNQINFSDFSLWLNMGSEKGTPYIKLKHREHNGLSRRLEYKSIDGMPTSGEKVTTSRDANEKHLFSEIGVETRVLSAHGTLWGAL